MIKFWTKRFKSNILTENLEFDNMVDSGSCNGCEAECNALSNPYYNLEKLGIYFVASPRHADVMLLSGLMTFNMTPYRCF